MGLEWTMIVEDVKDEEAVESWLQRDYEPFAVSDGQVFLKKQIITERDEPRSSVHPGNENQAGNEPDHQSIPR